MKHFKNPRAGSILARNAEKFFLLGNAENESGEEKMKKKRRRGEEKKKEEEKGGERKKEGKSLFLQGLYILSTYIVLC